MALTRQTRKLLYWTITDQGAANEIVEAIDASTSNITALETALEVLEQTVADIQDSNLDTMESRIEALENTVSNLEVASGVSYVVNVKDYGALGNGVADDTAAIATAKAALGASNGILFFPPGTYMISGTGILLGSLRKGTIFRGAGANVTTIKSMTGSGGWMMQGGAFSEGLVFEDITFDGNDQTAGVLVMLGANLDDITFRRCRIQNTARFIHASGITSLTVEDCWTCGHMKTGRTAIFLDNCRNVTVRRNKFLYWENGVIGDTGASTSPEEYMIENLVVDSNHFDGAWWMWPSLASNSGDGVTYAIAEDRISGTLTDINASFLSVGINETDTIRALEVARTGTLTSVNSVRVTDSGATYVTEGLYRGDILRCGSKWAFVSGIESETALGIEGWLDSTTNLPVSPPSAGASYTAYRLILAQLTLTDMTDTEIVISRWFRLTGEPVIPAAGTLYEIAHKPGYSGVHVEYGGKNCWITKNLVKRSWGDQISYYGNRGKIEDNIVIDGMDVGITINGHPNDGHNSIKRNTLIHNGSQNIWIGSSHNNVISDNMSIGGGWCTTLGHHFGAGITVQGSNYNIVERNFIDGENLPISLFGVNIVDASYNIVRHNVVHRVLMDEWAPNTVYQVGDVVRQLDGNQTYYCVQNGTSASSGPGPGGYTSNEVDGTTMWFYRGVNAEILLSGDDKTNTHNNRVYDNDTLMPPFHYASNFQYNPSSWVDGSFYGTIYGSGAPENRVTAGVGTVYIRNDGTAGMYIKSTGVGKTGWTQIT